MYVFVALRERHSHRHHHSSQVRHRSGTFSNDELSRYVFISVLYDMRVKLPSSVSHGVHKLHDCALYACFWTRAQLLFLMCVEVSGAFFFAFQCGLEFEMLRISCLFASRIRYVFLAHTMPHTQHTELLLAANSPLYHFVGVHAASPTKTHQQAAATAPTPPAPPRNPYRPPVPSRRPDRPAPAAAPPTP